MNIIDISWPIQKETTAYKDRKTIDIRASKTFEKDQVRESLITLSSHSGTHIDAPSHFLKDGISIDQVSLGSIIGPCTVIDLTEVTECITEEHLRTQTITPEDRILLKTRNSQLAHDALFDANFIYLDESGAQYLADHNVRCVGIDYLGIERNQPHHPTHTILLERDITIIEGLRLAPVQPGRYTLYCLPLALAGVDGSPARAILIP